MGMPGVLRIGPLKPQEHLLGVAGDSSRLPVLSHQKANRHLLQYMLHIHIQIMWDSSSRFGLLVEKLAQSHLY